MRRVIAGRRAVVEALRARPASLETVWFDTRERGSLREVASAARAAGVRIEERTSAELDEAAGGLRHQGVVALVAGEFVYTEFDALLGGLPPHPVLVLLDEITDPHNFGAIVRSAVAFGASGVVTLKHRACPVTPSVVRASAGATEHARIARVTNLVRAIEALRQRDVLVVGLDMDGDLDVAAFDVPPAGLALVVGSEGRGIRRLVRATCDRIASISMTGPIASLNAAVAAGIALHHAARARARALTP
jgi:23S rRNA (guanosine2251-2'-O)-methyltransferase